MDRKHPNVNVSNEERTDMLRDAQQMLYDAIDLIERAVGGTRHKDYTDAYITSHLKIMASQDHGYLSRDTNLDDMMRWFEGGEDDED